MPSNRSSHARSTSSSQTSGRRRSGARAGATVAALTLGAVGALAGTAAAAERFHVVEPGDTLAEIALDHGFEAHDGWRRVYDANRKLEHPDLIEAGQRLRIPSKDDVAQRRPLPSGYGQVVVYSTGSTSGSSTSSGSVWDSLAACESGGDWSTNTGNGYFGGLQFLSGTWARYGGYAFAASADRATREEQIAIAERVLASEGWSAWPNCSAKLGLR